MLQCLVWPEPGCWTMPAKTLKFSPPPPEQGCIKSIGTAIDGQENSSGVSPGISGRHVHGALTMAAVGRPVRVLSLFRSSHTRQTFCLGVCDSVDIVFVTTLKRRLLGNWRAIFPRTWGATAFAENTQIDSFSHIHYGSWIGWSWGVCI